MHARESVRGCVRGQGSGSLRGVGTHAAQHWVQRQVSAAACGWQSKNKSRVNLPADHGSISIQKFRIVASVLNRIK